ncbi:hypothetical protein FWK35_00000466, partial [Aphis craccivora]
LIKFFRTYFFSFSITYSKKELIIFITLKFQKDSVFKHKNKKHIVVKSIHSKLKSGKVGTALLYIRCRVDHYYILYKSIKFESNDSYHWIRKTILNEDDLSA